MIIASDGIWEFISSEEAVNIVSQYYIKKNVEEACNDLISTALKYWKEVI